ncbi:MAG: peptide ABC transporter substrate-binding protein [bacterium]|nr:peptide ABC transporter substrate-binding protein [bacterium]
MDSLKNKIVSRWRRIRATWSFFGFFKKIPVSQEEIDKKLVYSLSPRKIPTSDQIKHIKKFLNPREFLIVKICALVILANVVYLGVIFIEKHLEYLPLAGGEYIEGVTGYPKSINPLYAVNRDIDSDLSRLIYSSLFKYDQNGNLNEDLAEAVEVSANGKEYTIRIKDDIRWHNGADLTIDDVLFTLNLIKNPSYRSPLRFALVNVNAEKINDRTIKFILSEAYAPFKEMLTFGILPKNLWESINPDSAVLADLNLKPIGSGPYKFQSLVKNKNGELKEYHLTVNESYYGQPSYLKEISFKFFVNYSEAIKALNDNQVAGLDYLPFSYRKELLARDSLNFHELVQPQIVSLFFNYEKNKALSDKEVRVALASALDKDSIINEVFAGIYKRADGPILASNFAYNEAITKYNYFPEAAATTIKNKPLTAVLTVVDSGSNVAVGEQIKVYWEKAGVNITIRAVSGEQAANIVKERDFEILLYGESVGGDPDVYAFWHSSQIGAKGLNLAAYNNAEVDRLLVEGRTTTDVTERVSKYKKFQEIITNDLPVIWLYSPTYTYVQEHQLKGFSGTTIIEPADRFNDVGSWYLKTKKKMNW